MAESFQYCFFWGCLAVALVDALRLLVLKIKLVYFETVDATLDSVRATSENPQPNIGHGGMDRLLASKRVLFAKYRYKFKSREYRGRAVTPREHSWLISPGRFNSSLERQLRTAKRRNVPVTAFVNPKAPTEAYLSRSLSVWVIFIDAFIVALTLAALMFIRPMPDQSAQVNLVLAISAAAIGLVLFPKFQVSVLKAQESRATEL